MSNETLPQRHPVTRDKTKHPCGNDTDRWSVTGEFGKVVYDLWGNQVAVINSDDEVVEAMGKAFSNRVREYAELGDDDAVFATLADLYRTDLAGAPTPVPTLVDRALTALSAFGVTTEREAGQLLPMWLHYREMTADDREAVLRHYRTGSTQ